MIKLFGWFIFILNVVNTVVSVIIFSNDSTDMVSLYFAISSVLIMIWLSRLLFTEDTK